MVMLSYILLCVYSIPGVPDRLGSVFHCKYIMVIIIVRWILYGFCSFILIYIMRLSGAEVAEIKKSRSSRVNSIEGNGEGYFPVIETDDTLNELLLDS